VDREAEILRLALTLRVLDLIEAGKDPREIIKIMKRDNDHTINMYIDEAEKAYVEAEYFSLCA